MRASGTTALGPKAAMAADSTPRDVGVTACVHGFLLEKSCGWGIGFLLMTSLPGDHRAQTTCVSAKVLLHIYTSDNTRPLTHDKRPVTVALSDKVDNVTQSQSPQYRAILMTSLYCRVILSTS